MGSSATWTRAPRARAATKSAVAGRSARRARRNTAPTASPSRTTTTRYAPTGPRPRPRRKAKSRTHPGCCSKPPKEVEAPRQTPRSRQSRARSRSRLVSPWSGGPVAMRKRSPTASAPSPEAIARSTHPSRSAGAVGRLVVLRSQPARKASARTTTTTPSPSPSGPSQAPEWSFGWLRSSVEPPWTAGSASQKPPSSLVRTALTQGSNARRASEVGPRRSRAKLGLRSSGSSTAEGWSSRSSASAPSGPVTRTATKERSMETPARPQPFTGSAPKP